RLPDGLEDLTERHERATGVDSMSLAEARGAFHGEASGLLEVAGRRERTRALDLVLRPLERTARCVNRRPALVEELERLVRFPELELDVGQRLQNQRDEKSVLRRPKSLERALRVS